MGAECIQDQQGRSLCQLSSGMPEGSSQTLEPHAVREGTKLESWLGTIDAIVVMESALPNVFSLAHKRGVRSKIIFLNLEWSDPRQVSLVAFPLPRSFSPSNLSPLLSVPSPSDLIETERGPSHMCILSAERL
jgi:hypothetical protein